MPAIDKDLRQKGYFLAMGFLASIALLAVLFFFYYFLIRLYFPYDIRRYETYIAYNAKLFVDTGLLYRNPCVYPYLLNIYTPLYYLFSAFFYKVLSLNGFLSMVILCRALTFCISVGCSVLIYSISRRLKADMITAVLAGLLFLGNPALLAFGPVARVDLLALAFSLFALYVITGPHTRSQIYVACLFCLASFYAKQSYVSLFIAILICLLLERRLKDAFSFSASYLGFGIAIFMLLNIRTHGLFFMNTVASLSGIVREPQSLARVGAGDGWMIISPLALAAAQIVSVEKKNNTVNIYFFISAAIGVCSLYNRGAGVNYFLEIVAVSSLLGATYLSRLSRARNKLPLILSVLLIVFPYLRYEVAFLRGRFREDVVLLRPAKDALLGRLNRSASGFVLCNWDTDIAVRSGRPLVMNDWPMFEGLINKGICKACDIVSMIGRGGFDYIVFNHTECPGSIDWGSSALAGEINRKYILEYKDSIFYIFVPVGKTRNAHITD